MKTIKAGILYKDLKVVRQGPGFEIRTDSDFPVAIVYRSPGTMKEDDEQILAHQMAAAPEILKALRDARSLCDSLLSEGWYNQKLKTDETGTMNAIDAAIAKAESGLE